jgi:hypothetical protein
MAMTLKPLGQANNEDDLDTASEDLVGTDTM